MRSSVCESGSTVVAPIENWFNGRPGPNSDFSDLRDLPDVRDSVDAAVEPRDRLDAGHLCARDEGRPGEVDPVHLVVLERTKEQQRIDDHDRPEGRSPPGQLCDSLTLHLVERLEGEDDLGDDEVGNE